MLIAPVGVFGVHVAALRLYLAIVSAGLLAWVYWLWDATIGTTAAAVAAVAFASSWAALYFGSQAFPNLPLALLSVATVGLAVRAARGDQRAKVIAPFVLAAAALLRPSDATALLIAIVVTLGALHGRRFAGAAGRLAVGLFVGWLPWLVESFVLFGGPFSRFRMAALVSAGGGLRDNLGTYLRSFGGPLLNRVPGTGVPVWASILPLGLVVFSIASCVRFARDERIDGFLTCLCSAGAMAGTYLFFAGPTAPRFLLPAYALLAVPAAALLVDVGRRVFGSRRTVALLVAVALAAPILGWQGARAHTIWKDQVRATAGSLVLATEVAAVAHGTQCAVVSAFALAEVSVLSHCAGWSQFCPDTLADLRRRKVLIEGLAPARTASERQFATWSRVRSVDVGGKPWHLFILREHQQYLLPPGAPPCMV